jgi:glycolate oxidase
MQQPEPKPGILARKAEIIAGLHAILPDRAVISESISIKPYETDGLSAYRQVPLAVVLPEDEAQVVAVMKFCSAEGIRIIPRGAGTSLSGGALPMADAVVVGMMRMNKILEIN